MANNIKNNLLVEVSYKGKPKFWKGVDKMHRPLLELFGGKKVNVANSGELTSKKTQSSGWKKVAQSILVLIAWPIFMMTLTLKFFEKMPTGIEQRKGNLSATDEKTKAVNAGKSHAQPDNSQSSEVTPETKKQMAAELADWPAIDKQKETIEKSKYFLDDSPLSTEKINNLGIGYYKNLGIGFYIKKGEVTDQHAAAQALYTIEFFDGEKRTSTALPVNYKGQILYEHKPFDLKNIEEKLLAKTKDAKNKLAERNREALEASPLYHDIDEKGHFSYLNRKACLKDGEFFIRPLFLKMKLEPLQNQEEIAMWKVVIKEKGIKIAVEKPLCMLESGYFSYDNSDSEQHIVLTFEKLVQKIFKLSQSGDAFY